MRASTLPGPLAGLRASRLGMLLGMAAAVGVPLALVLWAGWREVLAAAGAIGPLALAAALATALANYLLRFARWARFVGALGHRVPLGRHLAIYLSGLALTATPAKAGELVRAVFLKPYGVPYGQSLVLFFWDRLSDLAGVTVLAVAAGGLLASGYAGLLPGVLAMLLLLWLARPGGPLFSRGLIVIARRLPRRLGGRLHGLIRLRRADARLTPGLALMGLAAGAAAYGAHGLGLYALARGLGAPLELTGAVLVVAVSTLMGAAALLPAGAGLVELTSVALLAARGVPQAEAVALGLVLRLTTFWLAIGLGAGCLATLLREERHARHQR